MSSHSRYTPNRYNGNGNRNYSSRGQGSTYSSSQSNNVNHNRGFKRKYNSTDSYSSSSSYKSCQNLYQQHSTPKDYENRFQMWMGDLDPSWTEESIYTMWSTLVAPPKSLKIMRDRLNPSKPSYCFVTFGDQEALDWALQRNGQMVPSTQRRFKLSHASARNNNPNVGGGSGRPSTGEFSLFVGDLAQDVSEAALYSKFNLKYPNEIKSARVVIDQNSKLGKGFGFVKFFHSATMERALKEMQGVMLGSKAIRVGIAAGSETTQTNHAQSKPDLKKLAVAQNQPELNADTDERNTNITISGLSSNFTARELELVFLSFGDLIYCKLSRDLQKGYVKFVSRNAAELAMTQLSDTVLHNCRLELTWGSSTKTGDDAFKYEPEIEGVYERDEKPLLLYVSSEYPHKNLGSQTSDELNAYVNGWDGCEGMSTQQVNEFYLKNKLAREHLV
ncbi:RNA recognition motif family protein [Candida parapsilosis]|uniref:RNA recognition motif family protein n=1 Tax=Candida parapsilosis TaxID=5480 RepID=A0A8X7NJZ0_CANPA|nr:RNA recognition motif family protein [Candida parapsilosis]KAF6046645.1 RNA recognition motif family protein [Candida parapsilosis]KAF6050914.1 RNA recognition motif family protein [Candida parapsilosis]KAF6062364.1 RNA recognition motif family protein [Candida parapsilosis]